VGFVKTPEEIEAIERVLSEPRFVSGERLTVEFLTDSEVVERLLPPPLEMAHTPSVYATVGRWRSNCLGDFAGGSSRWPPVMTASTGVTRSPCTWTPSHRWRSGATSSGSPRSWPRRVFSATAT
jgi:hypothetical protein